MDVLAARVRSLREGKDWTQEDLARESGLKRPHISLIETQERVPGADTLIKLATAFGVSTDYLLGLSDSLISITPEQFNDLSHDPNFAQLAAAWPDLLDKDQRVLCYIAQQRAQALRRERGEQE